MSDEKIKEKKVTFMKKPKLKNYRVMWLTPEFRAACKSAAAMRQLTLNQWILEAFGKR